jgi:hypothetical protein
MNAEERQQTRLDRLHQIAEEHTLETYDAETRDQLAANEPVALYAAVTSEGTAQSSYSSNGNLRVFGTKAEMEAVLAAELLEGWVAHGRIWNLDSEWNSWGNLELICIVQVREAESQAGRP